MNIDEDISSGYGALKRNFTFEGQILNLEFISCDPRKIRVAISSFLENMKLVL